MGDIGLSLNHLEAATPIISGFLLGYVALLPLLGRLSDILGRAPVFAGCLVVFAFGRWSRRRPRTSPGRCGRALQGVGGGGLVPVTLAIVADLWPAGRRGVPWASSAASRSWARCSVPSTGRDPHLLDVEADLLLNLPIAAFSAPVSCSPGRRGRPRPAPGPGGRSTFPECSCSLRPSSPAGWRWRLPGPCR